MLSHTHHILLLSDQKKKKNIDPPKRNKKVVLSSLPKDSFFFFFVFSGKEKVTEGNILVNVTSKTLESLTGSILWHYESESSPCNIGVYIYIYDVYYRIEPAFFLYYTTDLCQKPNFFQQQQQSTKSNNKTFFFKNQKFSFSLRRKTFLPLLLPVGVHPYYLYKSCTFGPVPNGRCLLPICCNQEL